MSWLIAVIAVLLFLGPLRPWVGRHWALFISLVSGAITGLAFAAYAMRTATMPAYTALAYAIVGAIAFATTGPRVLRKLAEDGKDEAPPRRH